MKNYRAVDLNTKPGHVLREFSPFSSIRFRFLSIFQFYGRSPATHLSITLLIPIRACNNNSTRFLALPICIEPCNEIVNIMRSWANEFLRFLRSRTRLSELDRNCRTDKDRRWKEEEEGNSRKIIREEYVRIYLFTFFALFFSRASWMSNR